MGKLLQHYVSWLVGFLVNIRLPRPLRLVSIKVFCWIYSINTEEAESPLSSYKSIGDFFIRDLRPGARPIEKKPGLLVSPADAVLRSVQVVKDGSILQVKGINYSVRDLLGNDELADKFTQPLALNFYLAPPDYHHVHSPLTGGVVKRHWIPGALWPVNNWSLNRVAGLFAVNERVALFLETEQGLAAVVMVGATCVGKISLAFDPLVTNVPGATQRNPLEQTICPAFAVSAGQRLGTFHMGSAAVVLLQNYSPSLVAECQALIGCKVAMGQTLGTFTRTTGAESF